MAILVTGGAGYIGTHTCVELLQAGYEVVVLDNFSNSHPAALTRVEQITQKRLAQVHGDVRDLSLLVDTLQRYAIQAVIHLAGLKAVGESVAHPLHYYDNNVIGAHRLLQAMQQCAVNTLVFSSSATVYGEPQQLPLRESHPLAATNPYGRSKWMIEEMLRDVWRAQPAWRIAILRYFNPVGAHPTGLIGEDPQGVPNNLMPFVAQVAVGKRDYLQIWGNDYPTPDGTGVRDYIHVVDLAKGHLKALAHLSTPQCTAINLGTGIGHSVEEVRRVFAQVSGQPVPFKVCERRAGDVAACYADPSLANQLLGWRAAHDLVTMCQDHWRWQSLHPNGYLGD